jgi:hypothetical protein
MTSPRYAPTCQSIGPTILASFIDAIFSARLFDELIGFRMMDGGAGGVVTLSGVAF